MSGVPTTDEEVSAAIDEYSDDHLKELLWKIYDCKRQMGASVVDAWADTLMAHILATSVADDAIARAEGRR